MEFFPNLLSRWFVLLLYFCCVVQGLDMLHPLKIAVVNFLRADFCQISNLNVDDIVVLPVYSRELAAMFINTLFAQFTRLEGQSL